MAQGVLVFAEVAQGGLAAIAKEMLGAGRRVADALTADRVTALQAFRDLLDDMTHRFEIGLRVVDHPLRKRLAFDELVHDVQVPAWPCLRPRLHDVRAVDTARDPFLGQQALEVGGVASKIHGGNLQHDGLFRFRIVNQCFPSRRIKKHGLMTFDVSTVRRE